MHQHGGEVRSAMPDVEGDGPAPGAGAMPVAVVCAANDAFAPSMAAMLHSVATHLPPGSGLRVFVLDDDISAESRERLERVTGSYRVPTELVWLEPDIAGVAGFKTLPAIPRTMYLRLQVGSLLPAGMERVIYLDTDMAVRADLTELWEMPLDGCTIAAVQNHFPSTVEGPMGIDAHRELGIDPTAPYFNSGLLVIDLGRWRAEGVEERSLEYIREHPEHLYFPDQEALNAALAGRWKVLSPVWNVLSSIYSYATWPDFPLRRQIVADEWTVLNGPKIVHYCGKDKPWMASCTHPLKDLYMRHMRECGWTERAPAGAHT